ncbi:MAG: hypothetical protein LBF61_05995 [Azoarcus sp.]|nr:hypothetical protein [Azoarcus sp.]
MASKRDLQPQAAHDAVAFARVGLRAHVQDGVLACLEVRPILPMPVPPLSSGASIGWP